MASLLISAAGAAIGSAIAPVGWSLFGISAAQYGWMIGSFLGSSLFAEEAPGITQEGPRLGDLKVQSSSYGTGIPRVFGRARMAGNMIWSKPIQETRHESTTSRGGGKGGGGGGQSVTTVSYTYSQTFALGICEGPIIGITKIWANGELIYNVSPDASASTLVASATNAASVTIYKGSNTQTANSLIQADVGAADCPAYRNLAYVVFENLQLADYSNRTPNIEFEVIGSGTEGAVITAISSPGLTGGTRLSYQNGRIAIGTLSGYPDAGSYRILYDEREYNVDSGLVRSTLSYNRLVTEINSQLEAIINWPGVMICSGTGPSPSWKWYNVFDQTKVPLKDIYPPDHLRYGVSWSGIKFNSFTVIGGGYNWNYVYVTVFSNEGSTPSESPYRTVQLLSGLQSGFADGGAYGDLVNNHYYYLVRPINAGATNVFLYKYSVPDMSLLDWWDLGTTIDLQTVTPRIGHYKVEDDIFYYLGKSSDYRAFRLNAGNTATLLGTVAIFTGVTGSPVQGYMPGIYWTPTRTYRLNGATSSITTSAGVTVSSILTSLCNSCGLTSTNVSQLSDDTITGYVVANRGPIREAIQPLMGAFYFDGVEVDGSLVFVQRGGSSVRTLTLDELAAREYGSSTPDAIVLERSQDVELPEELTISYMDQDAAYQIGTQYSRRLIGSSRTQQSMQLAMSMTATKAKQISDVLLYSAWQGRTTLEFSTTLKHADLVPTDLVYIPKAGLQLAVRLIEKDENGPIITWKAVADDPQAYSQNGAAATLPAISSNVSMVGPTNLYILDIPLLRDQDDGYGFYMAGNGYVEGWRGCQPFKSNDGGASYGTFGQALLNEVTDGTATNALGNFTQNIFDETNSVTILMNNGTLSSISELAVLNGGNAALLGDEIIQFRTATLTGTNTYVLTGLLRGRKGTEWATGTHAMGDRFVLLDSATFSLQPGSTAEIGQARKYKGVTFGGYLDEMPEIDFTWNNVAAKPYAPVLLGGGRNNTSDVIINWVRRTRVGGSWLDNADVILAEDSESYEIEIWTAGYAALKRTLTATTTTVTYTSAQQVTDFGSNQSTVYVRVYQLSALVGRGYKLEGTV